MDTFFLDPILKFEGKRERKEIKSGALRRGAD